MFELCPFGLAGRRRSDRHGVIERHPTLALSAYLWMTYAGFAKNYLGSYEQAASWFRRAIEANRNYPVPNFQLAAALAQLGRLDEARSQVKAGLALNPVYTASRDRAAWTAMSRDPTYLAQLEVILDGMRKAGVPES
jgi:tetratricopeptide (TPR) repeat protein